MAVVLGCGTVPTEAGSPTSTPPLRWPPEPADARILWETEIRGPVSYEGEPGWFKRSLHWVTGREPFQMVRPHGVGVDGKGRLWVTDPGAQRVYIFDVPNSRHEILPRKGDEPLGSPIAVTHDSRGVAYVSDSQSGTIRRFDAAGRSLDDWNANGTLERPTGVAYDSLNSLLWVVDTGSHRIVALDEQGRVVRSLGLRGSRGGEFNFPTHLAIDPKGRLVVTDTVNFRVQIISQDGVPVAILGGPGDGPGALAKPKGVALDSEGHIYVVDALFDNVQIFDEEGMLLLYFGEHGSEAGEFWLPAGIAISSDDRIYVVDAFNQRVQVFRYVGE